MSSYVFIYAGTSAKFASELCKHFLTVSGHIAHIHHASTIVQLLQDELIAKGQRVVFLDSTRTTSDPDDSLNRVGDARDTLVRQLDTNHEPVILTEISKFFDILDANDIDAYKPFIRYMQPYIQPASVLLELYKDDLTNLFGGGATLHHRLKDMLPRIIKYKTYLDDKEHVSSLTTAPSITIGGVEVKLMLQCNRMPTSAAMATVVKQNNTRYGIPTAFLFFTGHWIVFNFDTITDVEQQQLLTKWFTHLVNITDVPGEDYLLSKRNKRHLSIKVDALSALSLRDELRDNTLKTVLKHFAGDNSNTDNASSSLMNSILQNIGL